MATVKGRLKSTGDLLVIGEIDETSDVLSFDGVDDSVRTQDKLPINGSSATIEQWIKILGRGDRSWNILIELQDGSGGSRKGLYWDEDDYIYGAFENNGSGYAVLSGSDPVHNEWQHWACVIDDSNSELRFYVDGKLEATDSNSGSWDDLHCSIARRYDKDDMANIVVSDARIWNIARTQTEIQDNMNKRLTGNEPGLVAYYPLDEGTGTIAYDLVGNNDGVINGAT